MHPLTEPALPQLLAPCTAEEEIPANFRRACKGNVERAGRKWLASKQWREENDIGTHLLRNAYTIGRTTLLTESPPLLRTHQTTSWRRRTRTSTS